MSGVDAVEDPFLALEEVDGAEAAAFVAEQNARTLAFLGGPDFEADQEAFRAILSTPDKIPYIVQRGRYLYNFWQDAEHPRGLWRRTTMDSYRAAETAWDILLDIDALAEAEGENWVWRGCSTLPHEYRRGMVNLSRGGADACVLREFDLEARALISGGFELPEAKTDIGWADADTLLVVSPLGEGHATRSGYGRTVRRWRRGEPFAKAETIFAAGEGDMLAFVDVDHEPGAARTLLGRRIAFFDVEVFLLQPDGTQVRLDVPTDASPDVHRGWLSVELRSPWEIGGQTHSAGALLVIRLDEFLAGSRRFEVLFAPGPRRSLKHHSWGRSRVALSILDDMRSRIEIAQPAENGWRIEPLGDVASTETVDAGSIGSGADGGSSDTFLITRTGYLTPSTLDMLTPDGVIHRLKQAPAQFDASGHVVTQHEAIASDGARIPYFQVAPRDLKLDGANPTLLYGYGGFLVDLLPGYLPHVGKAWLERGGVYVVANIRGGGEFGPDWHKAGIREAKKRAQDDFADVARDLIARGVTSPARLGCQGGSNGGLLVGNMLTRHPELFGAVWCLIPLLDMRRYTQLLAGASWVAEYGDPDLADDWTFLQQISPYQLARAEPRYPPVLIWTSKRDDRVHPGHARKMAARLQELGQPVFFYEPPEGGHGTADFKQTAHMWALGFSFLRRTVAANPNSNAHR